MGDADGTFLIAQLPSGSEVHAVEIHPRGTPVPATLAGYTAAGGGVMPSPGGTGGGASGGSDCGVIAFWTKPIGGERDR